jgi:hypothetical protein
MRPYIFSRRSAREDLLREWVDITPSLAPCGGLELQHKHPTAACTTPPGGGCGRDPRTCAFFLNEQYLQGVANIFRSASSDQRRVEGSQTHTRGTLAQTKKCEDLLVLVTPSPPESHLSSSFPSANMLNNAAGARAVRKVRWWYICVYTGGPGSRRSGAQPASRSRGC